MGERTISISKEVLLQVQRDGITYKNLAKDMATVILEGMENDPFSSNETVEFIAYGEARDFSDENMIKMVKDWSSETGLPVLAETYEDRVVRMKNGTSLHVSRYKVWPRGE